MAEIIFGSLAIALFIVWSLFGAYGVLMLRAERRKNRVRWHDQLRRMQLAMSQDETVARCPDCGCVSVILPGGRCQLCTDIAQAVWEFHNTLPSNQDLFSGQSEQLRPWRKKSWTATGT